jgi:3'-5' exonuclease
MRHQNLFVFDLKTIPDIDTVFNLTGFSDTDIEAKRAEMISYHITVTGGKNPFPRQPFHKVVAISYFKDGEHYHLRELRTGSDAGFDEKLLLQGFFNYFERLKPRLVSYNGCCFDLPVLKYGAMTHRI